MQVGSAKCSRIKSTHMSPPNVINWKQGVSVLPQKTNNLYSTQPQKMNGTINRRAYLTQSA